MTTIETKRCSKCEETKATTEFHAHSKQGFQGYCKECDTKRKRSFDGKCSYALDRSRRKAKELGVENTLALAEVKAILSVKRCAYCHEETDTKKRTLDHVIPMTESGGNTFENVVMACLTCNKAKNSRPVYDFIMKQRNSDATRLLLATLGERMDVHPIEALRLLERQQTAFTEKRFRAKHYGESAQ